MDIPENMSLVLFDGVCNLCDSWVHRIIRNDPNCKFCFASLQSDLGRKICEQNGVVGNETLLLVQNDHVYLRSRAAFRILKELNSPLKLLAIFRIIPSFLTDIGYNFIARNRYEIHGKKDSCLVPDKRVLERFIDL